jgi:hypothetical protein
MINTKKIVFAFVSLFVLLFIFGCVEEQYDTQPRPEDYPLEISKYCEKDSDCVFICGLGYLSKANIIPQNTIDSLEGLACSISGPPICFNNECAEGPRLPIIN